MNTLKGNKLIALFRGWVESGFDRQLIFNSDTGEEFKLEDLKFHASWDWLMPVVEKIEELNAYVMIDTNSIKGMGYCRIIFGTAHGKEIIKDGHSKLEATYKAVFEFIQWWNNQNK